MSEEQRQAVTITIDMKKYRLRVHKEMLHW